MGRTQLSPAPGGRRKGSAPLLRLPPPVSRLPSSATRALTSLAVLFMVGPAVVPGIAVAGAAGHGERAVTATPGAANPNEQHSKDVRFASLGWKVQTVAGPNPVLD